MSQGLQDLHLDHMVPAFLLLRATRQRLQEGEHLSRLLLSQQNACPCHILAFTSQRGWLSRLLHEFLCPLGGTLHLSTGQPELHPLYDEEDITPVGAVVFRQGCF